MIKIIQGDSYWADISRSDGSVMDANWSGKWAIVTALGTTPLVSGTMAKSGDNMSFQQRITPTNTLAVPVGTYILITQIDNSTLAYSSEITQTKIQITTQGIV